MTEFIEKVKVLSKCEEMWNNADETTQAGVDTINAIDRITDFIEAMPVVNVQPVDNGKEHIIYIGRKAYLAENTIMEFMRKMDIIRDSLAYIENYFDTYAETIQQINVCAGRCTDITEVKYFIDRIKENSKYD
jgi:hypothetical protein